MDGLGFLSLDGRSNGIPDFIGLITKHCGGEIYVPVLVQTSQPFGGSFDMFGGEIADAAVFHDTHQPPVAVAVVEKNHGITLGCVRLPFDRGNKGVEGVYEFEIDVLIFN